MTEVSYRQSGNRSSTEILMQRKPHTLGSLMAILCLWTALFAFAVESEVNAENEHSVETIVKVEEAESPSWIRTKRFGHTRVSKSKSHSSPDRVRLALSHLRFFVPKIERDALNGLGSYLRT